MFFKKIKRETGFEPATLAFARRYSTTEPLAHKIYRISSVKRVMGIEPTYLAWKASVLPLNYTRTTYNIGVTGFEPATFWSQTRRSSQAEPHPAVFLYLFVLRCPTQDILYVKQPQMSTPFFIFFLIFFEKVIFYPSKSS